MLPSRASKKRFAHKAPRRAHRPDMVGGRRRLGRRIGSRRLLVDQWDGRCLDAPLIGCGHQLVARRYGLSSIPAYVLSSPRPDAMMEEVSREAWSAGPVLRRPLPVSS
jgi:hypothetical protein